MHLASVCADTDLSGLSVVNVTAGVGQVRLLAEAPEACEDAQDSDQCKADWDANEARKVGGAVSICLEWLTCHVALNRDMHSSPWFLQHVQQPVVVPAGALSVDPAGWPPAWAHGGQD